MAGSARVEPPAGSCPRFRIRSVRTSEQVAACTNKSQLEECTLDGVETARCYDGVCIETSCGNLRVELGEQCDDGNTNTGDGCAADCLSNETCGNGKIDAVKSEACDDSNNIDHDGCSSSCARETLHWVERTVTPPGRSGGVTAYDPIRDRVVMFAQLGSFPVAAGQNISVVMTGMGDADVYVKFGSEPTTAAYDCRPYDPATNETCTLTAPAGATQMFVGVNGYAASSTFALKITTGGSVPTGYVFNANAAKLYKVQMDVDFIAESAAGTDGHLGSTINTYTHQDHYDYILEVDANSRSSVASGSARRRRRTPTSCGCRSAPVERRSPVARSPTRM